MGVELWDFEAKAINIFFFPKVSILQSKNHVGDGYGRSCWGQFVYNLKLCQLSPFVFHGMISI